MCDQTTNTVNQIKTGKIKGYAVTTKDRLAVLPDLPTLGESGVPGLRDDGLARALRPAGTPKEIIEKLSSALQVAVQDPKVIERFADLGIGPAPPRPGDPCGNGSAPPGRDRQVEADHRGGRRLRRLNAAR